MNGKLLKTFGVVGVGGASGTLFRYIINLQGVSFFFPYGTLIENLLGSFLLGFLTGILVYLKVSELWKVGLGVGFCGGFTTMSTLAADYYHLFAIQEFLAIIYISISIFGGVILALLGYIFGEKLGFRYQATKKAGEAN